MESKLSLPRTFVPWYFRSLELLYPGTFALESKKMTWTFHSPLPNIDVNHKAYRHCFIFA